MIISQQEIVKCAEIIVSVIKKAEELNPMYQPTESTRFNVLSMGQEMDEKFIMNRRMEKEKYAVKSTPPVPVTPLDLTLNPLNPTPPQINLGVVQVNHPIDQLAGSQQSNIIIDKEKLF